MQSVPEKFSDTNYLLTQIFKIHVFLDSSILLLNQMEDFIIL